MDRVQLGCITAGIREKTGFNCSSILGPKPYSKGTWLRKEEKAHPEPKKNKSPEDTSSHKVLDLEVMQHNHADEASDVYMVMFITLVNR